MAGVRRVGRREGDNDRHHPDRCGDGRHPVDGGLRARLRAHLMFDLILAGAVSLGLLGYLLWALIRPEDF
jgi:K+-transporting ATPase KdpF subunit